MIAGDGADGAADVDDFRGSKIGRECGDYAGARHGDLNVPETQKRMTTEIDAISLHGRHRTSGADGGISLNENHAGHFTSHELSIVGARRCTSPLGRDATLALQLICELLQGGRVE